MNMNDTTPARNDMIFWEIETVKMANNVPEDHETHTHGQAKSCDADLYLHHP